MFGAFNDSLPDGWGRLLVDRVLTKNHMAGEELTPLETSHREPNFDYYTLMLLTHNYTELEKLYRLMCFNVFAHNRDDHSKNFTWLFDNFSKEWHLSPAYDLTYSNSIGGEHAATVDGEGKNPGMTQLLSVAKKAGLCMAGPGT